MGPMVIVEARDVRKTDVRQSVDVGCSHCPAHDGSRAQVREQR